MKKFEKIYDILFTPVEKMTDDQVKFLEKVLDVNKKRKLKPWCVLGNLILTASIITTMVLTCTTLPSGVLPILICSAGTAGLFGTLKLSNKINKMVDYKSIGTDVWRFDELVYEDEIKQIEQKLAEYDDYQDQLMLDYLISEGVDFLGNDLKTGKPKFERKKETENTNKTINSTENVRSDEKTNTNEDFKSL